MATQRFPWVWGWVVLAAVVRLIGITWGLPDGTHFFSYHPDEFETAGRVLHIYETGDWDPEFFAYGSFYLYLTTILAWPFRAIGWIGTVTEAHLAARLVTVLLACGTVLLTYRITDRLRGRTAAGIAAALVTLCPGHVLHSHFGTVDGTVTFLMTLCLFFAVRAGAASPRAFVLAAAAAGLATGTKYNAGIVVVAPLFLLLTDAGIRRAARARTVAWMALAGVGAFLVAVPYAVLDFPTFWDHASFEIFQHPREGHANVFTLTGNGWWYHLTHNLPYALGWPWLVISVAGLAAVIGDQRRAELAMVVFALVYFFGIGFSNVRFLRYTLPIVPVLAFAAAALATGKYTWAAGAVITSKRMMSGAVAPRTWVVAGLAVGWAAVLTAVQLVPWTQPDPRDAALAWLAPQAGPGTSVGMVGIPWFSQPPVTPWNGGERTRSRYANDTPVRIVPCEEWSVTPLTIERPEWFLLSEFDVREEIRLGEAPAAEFLRTLNAGWVEAASFDALPVSQRRLFGGYAPHDWLYPYAGVKVFRRREP